MSSLRNALPRRAHKERSQPAARKKFGLLEKHKDYVVRAQAYHNKEDARRRLEEKAANRNPDEFYFKMIHSKTVDGVHREESEANKYTQEELMLMNTQDIGYFVNKIQSEKKKIERLSSVLHTLDTLPPNKHIYYAEDREEAKEIQARPQSSKALAFDNLPKRFKKYKHLIWANVGPPFVTSLQSGIYRFWENSCLLQRSGIKEGESPNTGEDARRQGLGKRITETGAKTQTAPRGDGLPDYKSRVQMASRSQTVTCDWEVIRRLASQWI